METKEFQQLLKEYLKEHLSIETEVEREYDYGSSYNVIRTSILLDGEVITSSSAYWSQSN